MPRHSSSRKPALDLLLASPEATVTMLVAAVAGFSAAPWVARNCIHEPIRDGYSEKVLREDDLDEEIRITPLRQTRDELERRIRELKRRENINVGVV